MFEELSKIYDIEWDKDLIKMMDLNITIEPPYLPENVKGGDHQKTLQKIQKKVSSFIIT